MRTKKTKVILLFVMAVLLLFFGRSKLVTSKKEEVHRAEPEQTYASVEVSGDSESESLENRRPSSIEGGQRGPSSLENTDEQDAAKQIRQEMATALYAAYASQKASYEESQSYSTDFYATGFWYEGKSSVFNFKIGYLDSYYDQEQVSLDKGVVESTDDLIGKENEETKDAFKYSKYAERISLSDLKKYCRQGCGASQESFEMISASNLDGDDTLDVWIMNEKKELIHASDDLKE